MENISRFGKLVDIEEGLFIGDEDMVVNWASSTISKKIRSNIIDEVRRIGFSPDDYWSTAYARVPFVDVSDELEEVKVKIEGLSENMDGLRSEVLSCKECINRLSDEFSGRPIIKETQLFEIGEGVEVLQPIPIVIEETEEEVIASFPEIEAFGVGAGEAEAIRDLKEEIRKLFFELENISEDELGKLPISWKRVLLKVVKNIGNAQ